MNKQKTKFQLLSPKMNSKLAFSSWIQFDTGVRKRNVDTAEDWRRKQFSCHEHLCAIPEHFTYMCLSDDITNIHVSVRWYNIYMWPNSEDTHLLKQHRSAPWELHTLYNVFLILYLLMSIAQPLYLYQTHWLAINIWTFNMQEWRLRRRQLNEYQCILQL